MVRRTMVTLILLVLSGLGLRAQSPQTAEQTKSLNLSAYAELLRSDVRAQKVAILTEVLGLTEAEDAAFWPIYREYDLEMSRLGDERVALIEEYARSYSQMTDAIADTARRQGARPRGTATGTQGEVPRPRQESAVAANGPAVSAGRAPAAADHRPASRGGAPNRQVGKGS